MAAGYPKSTDATDAEVTAAVAAEAAARTAAITAHSDDTSSVHGIADTTALATDAEVTAAVSAHDASTGVHSALFAAKQSTSAKGQANGYAALGSGGVVPIAQLATGTADGTKFIRDDGTLQSVASSSGGLDAEFRPEDYGAEGDVVTVTDGSIAAGQAVFSTPSYIFTSADVGKLFAVDGALARSSTNALGTLLTTILSVSGGNATLAASATQTVAGREASWSTNDDAALASAAAAAIAVGGTVALDGKSYGFTHLTIAGAMTMRGTGVFGAFGTFASGVGNFTPADPPWLRGSVLKCFAAGQSEAVLINAESAGVNLRHFGIVFAQKWASTGHGIRSNPGANKNGVSCAHWDTVMVFGHDGNSYGFYLTNAAQNVYTNLFAWGGGWVKLDESAGSDYGNSTFVGGNGKIFVGGSAHYCHMSSVATRMTFVGTEFNAHNLKTAYASRAAFANIWAATTSAQRLFLVDGNTLRGLSLIGPSFDSGSAAIGEPLLEGAKTNGGVFLDPGHFSSTANPPQDNGLPMIAASTLSGGGVMPHGLNLFATHTAAATIPSTSVYNRRECDATLGAFPLTLPAASAMKGRAITFMKVDASANAVTIQRAGTDTINGATTRVLAAQWDAVTLVCNGTAWRALPL